MESALSTLFSEHPKIVYVTHSDIQPFGEIRFIFENEGAPLNLSPTLLSL